jgi:formate dehydrogenase major subunit
LGRGGATTALWDLVNSDCILIQGSNMAECHPVGYRFVMQAREKGATIIHVDPRFTRTSATANLYAPIRSGTDIVFLGGLIRYVLENALYFKEYVLPYTNAAFLVNPSYQDTEELDGLFSGYDGKDHTYNPATWQYVTDENNQPKRDDTLQDPHCVLQIMKRHFKRYTPEMVEQVCGTPKETFLKIAETITRNSGRDKTTCLCYAVGFTQHSTGVQIIRTAAILQLLLGNIGRPGGGILALRGHATIQGSTDIPTLYNMLPGYMPVPEETKQQKSLAAYLQDHHSPSDWWSNLPKYLVSLLKAWYGENATPENDFCFHYLPKLNGDYSYNQLFFDMHDGKIKGLFVMGENLGVGGINAHYELSAMQKLDWCVVRDLFPVETGDFWRLGEADPATVPTEVFLMPAAAVTEKDGSFTNTNRLVQWHEKAVDPPGDARSEAWFIYHLGQRLKDLYADSNLERDRPIQHLQWDIGIKPGEEALQEPDVEAVSREISGYYLSDKRYLKNFTELQADGSTVCGCWIYSGMVTPDGKNRAANRQADPPTAKLGDPEYTNHSGWGFAWPANRRILYNRAGADPQGQAWSENKKLIWWQGERWTGFDVPDFPSDKAPATPANPHGQGIERHSGANPFIMLPHGVGQLFVPQGLADGPLPTHYEAIESPVENSLYHQQANPVEVVENRPANEFNPAHTPLYPHVVTTYRLTEHHTSGGMSRWVSWLSELQPELFAEIDPLLAEKEKLVTGDWATIFTARGELETKVLVTGRITPLKINGQTVHQIGLPYHWGAKGIVTGDTVNNLIPLSADPNVHIHEAKTFTAGLRKGRRNPPAPAEPVSGDGTVQNRGGEAGHLNRG